MGDFTSDWFSSAIPGIASTLRRLERQPSRFLEIGSWEGRSACWFMNSFPDASIVCVDTFEGSPEHYAAGLQVGEIKMRFMKNTAAFGDRVTVRQGHSSRMLFGLEPEFFDCIYVDGSHTEIDTLTDLVMSFNLLRPGGALLIDDFDQPAFPGVKAAVDAFAKAYSSRLEVVHVAYQVHLLKKA